MKADNENLPALAPFAASLVEAERRRPGPSGGVRRRLWRRTSRTLLAAGLLPALVAGKAAAAALASKLAIAALVGAVAGGAGLTVIMKARSPHLAFWSAQGERTSTPGGEPVGATKAAVVARPEVYPLPPPVASEVVSPTQAAFAQEDRTINARAGARARTGAPGLPGTVARERALIEAARGAIARKEGAAALRALDRHAQAFPEGLFEEEREAMRVSAWALAGSAAEARTRADNFRSQFPHSVFLDLVDHALRALP
jgi:hypothetical protein